jgi:hypothetical protein
LTPAQQHVTRHPGSSAECHAARDHRSNQAIAHIWTFGNPESTACPTFGAY